MPKIFELSVYTCFFYFLVWVIWIFLIVPSENIAAQGLGSLAFLPHAARVLPVLFFGGRSIPAIYFSEFIATNYIGELEYTTVYGALISSTAILISWGAFKLLDVDLKSKRVLQNTDWKHVTLFVLVSALVNGVGNGAYYLYLYEVIDPLITIRFVIGDIVGATIVILSLMFLTGFIKIPDSKND